MRATITFCREFAAFAGRRGLVALMLLLAGSVVEGFGIVLLVPLLSLVVGAAPSSGRIQKLAGWVFQSLETTSPFEEMLFLLVGFGVAMILRAFVIRARDLKLAQLQIGFVESQRARIAQSLASARWDQVANLRHARITHLMSGDVQRIGTAAHFFLQCVVALAMLAVQCALAFVLSPLLAFLAFALLIVSALALLPSLRRARDLGAFATNANLLLLNATTQFLGGLKLAMSQNLQSRFVNEFEATLHDLTDRQIATLKQQTENRILLSTLAALVGAVLVLVGFGWLHLGAPVLITLLLLVARMSGPATQIQQGAQQVAQALPAYQKVKELEQELGNLASIEEAVETGATLSQGEIVFENVTFLHGEGEGGVRDLSLRIAPGEFLGIAGPSGGGKTTFADLLVGLFPPQQGKITVGGQILEGETLSAWRNHLSYVSQDPYLFHDSIRRNLAWADPAASEEDMWRALAVADAANFVRRLGLDAILGERGALISGGERQRIALARALLRKPNLIVLDEATNAIDIASEAMILKNLRALPSCPTIVMVAHRNESLALCDRVLELSDG